MMSDYARAIGGHTEITSAPVKGTTVSLTVVMEPPHLIPLVPENGGEHHSLPFRRSASFL